MITIPNPFPTPAPLTNKVNPGYKSRLWLASLTKHAATPLTDASKAQYEVPLSSEVTYTPAGNIATQVINNLDGASVAVRLGQSDTLAATTNAGASNAVVRDLVELGNGKDEGKAVFVYLNNDGLYLSGELVIQQAAPQSPTGGIGSYAIAATVNGRPTVGYPDPEVVTPVA